MKALVVSCGNDCRNDDGAGGFVVAELAGLRLPGVVLRAEHQLEVDLVEDVRDLDLVVFVDASVPESPAPWSREEVAPGFRSHAVAHFLAPGDVLGLCRALHGRAPRGVLFRIRGRDFNFGSKLSPETRSAALEVVREVAALVGGTSPVPAAPRPGPTRP